MTHYQFGLQVHCSLSLLVPVDGPEEQSQKRSGSLCPLEHTGGFYCVLCYTNLIN